MKQEMLINVAQPEECRIAIVEDGMLEELYVERAGQDNYVGNIYKGVVVNLEPSIQAAFVDFGVGRNGFLHVSDIEPQYFRQGGFDPRKAAGPPPPRRAPRRNDRVGREDESEEGPDDRASAAAHPPFQRPAPLQAAHPGNPPPRRRAAGAGDQGRHRHQGADALHLHQHSRPLPGAHARPGPGGRLAEDRRRHASAASCATSCSSSTRPRASASSSAPPASTAPNASSRATWPTCSRLWKVIARRIKRMPAPADIYEESDMIIRTIRDIFTGDVDAIYIDEPKAFERAKEFLQLVMPRYVHRLQLYEGKEPLFCKYNLDEEIAKIHRRRVPLEGRRLDRHRSDRGPGGHRRQQRQLPRRGLGRGNRLPDEPATRPRKSPASSASATWAA